MTRKSNLLRWATDIKSSRSKESRSHHHKMARKTKCGEPEKVTTNRTHRFSRHQRHKKKKKRPTLLPYGASVCLYLKREMTAWIYRGESLPGEIWTGSWDKDLECTLHGLATEWWRSFSRPHHLPVMHISEPAGFAGIYCWFPQPLREHLQLCLRKLLNQQIKD